MSPKTHSRATDAREHTQYVECSDPISSGSASGPTWPMVNSCASDQSQHTRKRQAAPGSVSSRRTRARATAVSVRNDLKLKQHSTRASHDAHALGGVEGAPDHRAPIARRHVAAVGIRRLSSSATDERIKAAGDIIPATAHGRVTTPPNPRPPTPTNTHRSGGR